MKWRCKRKQLGLVGCPVSIGTPHTVSSSIWTRSATYRPTARQPTISTDRKTKRSFPFDDMSLVLSSHIFLPWLMTLMNFGPNHVSLEFYRWANCLVSCECLVASVLFSQMVWDYSTSRPRPTDMHRSARRAFKSTSTTIHNNKWGPFLTPSLDTSSIVFYSPAFHHLLLCLMASAAFP